MTIDIYIIMIAALTIYCVISYKMISRLHDKIELLEGDIKKIKKQNPRLRR